MKEHIQYNIKNIFITVFVILIWTALAIQCKKAQMQKDISDAVIRFHVIANSDSKEDQADRKSVV